MKHNPITYLYFALAVILLACITGCVSQTFEFPSSDQPFTHAVEIRKDGDAFKLFRNGKKYFIKGAGGERYFRELKANGGNSIRTWSTENLQQVLDSAEYYGLSVLVGLDVWPERLGMNYNDQQLIAEQKERIRKDILRYKDHPAVLIWAIGNELDLEYENDNVWRAVNDIAAMIHEIDPDHPTATVIMPNGKRTRLIRQLAPEIDILCFNVFGGALTLHENLRQFWWGWKGPYIISEWGGLGWWEREQTQWQVPIDMQGSRKRDKMVQTYQSAIARDTNWCLGSYVFYWGNRQERTHTWFSFYTEEGHPTSLVEAMHYNWTGSWPENCAPVIDSIKLNGRIDSENIYLARSTSFEAWVKAGDPENDSLKYYWEIRPEGKYIKITGGDREERPQPIEGLIEMSENGNVRFKTPDKPGPYRLFVYISDSQDITSIADVPFYVTHHSID